jgi:hypothetical protein
MAGLKVNDELAIARPLIRKGEADAFARKIRAGLPVANAALDAGLVHTPYLYEAVAYAAKAKKLQDASLAGKRVPKVGDPLMEAIPIYNTVQRRYAGFSNVLEQLWYGHRAPKYQANKLRGFVAGGSPWQRLVKTLPAIMTTQWLYICLAHRITGSGASFEWDHGFRNSRILAMSEKDSVGEMATFLSGFDGPIFTSIGNQIPPFPPCGGRAYLVDIAPDLVNMTYASLTVYHQEARRPVGIKEAVDMVLKYHRVLGCKQFKFVLTAWVMDIAEYLPHLVDPTSDCYHGKNAIESVDLCFDKKASKPKGQAFYDVATRIFAKATGTNPMDVEDAAPGCDLIRWIENYVPKKGFDHVIEQGLFNGSSLVWDHGRQPLPF